MSLRLLRGRVMIAPDEPAKTDGLVIIPDTARDKRTNYNTLGIGVVRMIGPPALTPMRWDAGAQEWKGGTEVPTQFKVGDRVRYVGQHVSRLSCWDGEDVAFCSVEEVQCVIEP